jgi:hypothetical protein
MWMYARQCANEFVLTVLPSVRRYISCARPTQHRGTQWWHAPLWHATRVQHALHRLRAAGAEHTGAHKLCSNSGPTAIDRAH